MRPYLRRVPHFSRSLREVGPVADSLPTLSQEIGNRRVDFTRLHQFFCPSFPQTLTSICYEAFR